MLEELRTAAHVSSLSVWIQKTAPPPDVAAASHCRYRTEFSQSRPAVCRPLKLVCAHYPGSKI